VVIDLAEFAHDGAVAFGNGEAALQRAGSTTMAGWVAEEQGEFGVGGGVHRRPVEFVAGDGGVFGGGADGFGLVDLVGREVAVGNGLAQPVEKVGRSTSKKRKVSRTVRPSSSSPRSSGRATQVAVRPIWMPSKCLSTPLHLP
jgi:hypothetical protein